MNQILDRSEPKKQKAPKNPDDTRKIVKVYAFLIILFAICFIAKGGYSLVQNNGWMSNGSEESLLTPRIELFADEDILIINASYSQNIESITYQWYRGIVTNDEILEYEANREDAYNNSVYEDDEIQEDNGEIRALGETVSPRDFTPNTSVQIKNIGIPQGDSTIKIVVRGTGNVTSEFIQSYHTDVGVDMIAPEIKVKLQGKKLIVTAVDETEMGYIVYRLNNGMDVTVSDRTDKKTVVAEIELDTVNTNSITINAVDKTNTNTGTYTQDIELYIGTPEISFSAEPDFSKIYVYAKYSKGITKIEYEFNGENVVLDYEDDPEKEVEIELDCIEGENTVVVKVYTDEEQVYAEDTGVCTYNP